MNFVEKYYEKTEISVKIFAYSVQNVKINKRGATFIRVTRVRLIEHKSDKCHMVKSTGSLFIVEYSALKEPEKPKILFPEA